MIVICLKWEFVHHTHVWFAEQKNNFRFIHQFIYCICQKLVCICMQNFVLNYVYLMISCVQNRKIIILLIYCRILLLSLFPLIYYVIYVDVKFNVTMSADVIYVGICDEINILVIYLFSGFGFFLCSVSLVFELRANIN